MTKDEQVEILNLKRKVAQQDQKINNLARMLGRMTAELNRMNRGMAKTRSHKDWNEV